MSKVRVLAIEDDPLHAEKLRFYVEEMGYEVIDIVDNAKDALQLCHASKPDVVLMDIQIHGEGDGIEVAHKIKSQLPTPLIYTTSFSDQETIQRAAQTAPDAYLPKPIEPASLRTAIELAIYKFSNKQTEFAKPEDIKWSNDVLLNGFIFVKVGDYLKKIALEELQFIRSAGEKYCDVHTQEQKFAVRNSLSDLLEKLPANLFLRCHRACIINLKLLEDVNEKNLTLKVGSHTLPIGRTYKADLMRRINLLG